MAEDEFRKSGRGALGEALRKGRRICEEEGEDLAVVPRIDRRNAGPSTASVSSSYAPPPMQRVRLGHLRDQGRDEALFWDKQSVTARVAAALKLHAWWLEVHGQASRRLDRVLEVARRESGALRGGRRARGRRARAAPSTADLDLLVEPTLDNGRRVVRALEKFGFAGLDARSITQPDTVVFLGREPFRIDLLTSIDGVTWNSAWTGRLRSQLGGVPVSFLGIRQLLRNKRAAGRPKDLADVALLTEKGRASAVARPGRLSAKRKRRRASS